MTSRAPRRHHRHRHGDAGRQRRGDDLGRRCSPAAAASRRSRASTRSGFPTRIAAEVKDFDAERVDRRPQAAQVRQPLAPVRAGRRRGGVARRRRPARLPKTAERWGCAVGTGMMGVDLRRTRCGSRHRGAERRVRARQRCSTGRLGADPMAFCRSQSTRGLALLTRQLRHPRLRDLGPHRVRLRRPGDRHRAEGDAPRHRRLRARRRLRLDDQPDRPLGLLPAGRALDGQRHAGARQPPVRRHPQRLRAGRRRGLPRARGVGRGARARRAHLRRAGRRRQFAVAAIASPTRIRPATARSRRCGRRWPMPARRRTRWTT